MATAGEDWKRVENKNKRKKKMRKKGPTEDSTPISTDEEIPVCDYYHEAMHLLKEDGDIIGNIVIEEVMMTKLLWLGILTEQEKSYIGRCAKSFVNVLLNKADPSIWVHVFEGLKSCDQARKVHECVVQKIEERCKHIKDNPSIILRTRRTESATPMHQNNAKLAYLLCTYAPTHMIRHIMQVQPCRDLLKNIRARVKDHPEEYELSEEDVDKIEVLGDLGSLKEANFPFVIKVFLITIHVVRDTDVGVSAQLMEIYQTLKRFQTNIYLQSSKGITSLMLKAQRDEISSFLSIKDSDETCSQIPDDFNHEQYRTLFETLSSTIGTSKETTRQLIERNAIALETLKGKMPYLLKRIETLADVLEFQRQLPPCFYGKLSFHNIDSMKKTIDEVLGSQHTLLEKVSTIEQDVKHISQGVKDLRKIREKCDERHTNVDLRKALDFHENSFKILVVNESSHEEEITSQICLVIGCTPWNIILELDHNTRQSGGFHDKMTEIFRVNNQYKVFPDACNISLSDSEEKKVCSGELALWILCNGCSQNNIDRNQDNFTRVKLKLSALLDRILYNVQKPKNVFSLFLRLSPECHDPMAKLASCISDACGSNKLLTIDISRSILIAVDVFKVQNAVLLLPDLEIETSHKEISTTSFITTFANKYNEIQMDNKYFFPGRNGECYLTQVQMTRISTTVQVFHKNIGQERLNNLSTTQLDNAIREERIRFLRGEPITHEALFLHEYHDHIYVIRDVMTAAKKEVLAELQTRSNENVNTTYNSQHYTILHEPSSGGSMVLQFLLFKLKDSYPCVLIKTGLLEETADELNVLYQESKLPLLIGVDNYSVSLSSICSLKELLMNKGIPCVIIHVCWANVQEPEVYDHQWSIKVSNELENGGQDIVRFKRLYEKVSKTIDTNKVFLFGLLAFLMDYARLSTIVIQSLAYASEDQKRLLRIIWTLQTFSNSNLDRRLVSSVLKSKDKSTVDDETLLYGDIRNLLKMGNFIKLVHPCLLKPLKTILFECQSGCDLLKCVVTDLVSLVKLSKDNKILTGQLCSCLFIQRHNSLLEHYSKFILELQKELSVEYIIENLEEFVKMLDGTEDGIHLRAVFARFLLHESKNISKSIEEIRRALNVQETSIAESNFKQDSTLLAIYGWLYKSIMTKRFHENKKWKGKQILLMEAVNDAKEADFAFRRSQTLRTKYGMMYAKFNPQSFLGEAKTKHALLKLVFEFYCESDKDKFAKYLEECEIEFLVHCEQSALKALEDLDWLDSLNKLHDNDPKRRKQDSIQCKFQLLDFRCDGKTAFLSNFRNVPLDFPCDFGAIIRSRQTKDKTYQVTPWPDLCKDELNTLYCLIDERRSADNLLSNNYYDVIMAMIYLKPHNIGDFEIDNAIEWARLWKSKYPDIAESYFMHGMLLLAQATHTEDQKSMREAKQSFERCKELLRLYPSVKGLRQPRFFIGCQKGLARVVPFNHGVGKGSLETFEGRLLDKRQVQVNKFGVIFFAKLGKPESEDIIQSQQQPKIKFNIAVSYNDIVAMNAMNAI